MSSESHSGSAFSSQNAVPGLSRRSFLALSAGALASCSASASQSDGDASSLKTTANPNYQPPDSNGPLTRNPDMPFSSDFSKISDISFSSVPNSGKYVAMTFDDGPHPQNTPRLLKMLAERNIKATFFVIGGSAALYPQILRQTLAEGHEIGNHTWSHRVLSKLSMDGVRTELRRCHDAVAQATGYQMRTMRPPYGALTKSQREVVHSEFGYPTILWSVDPLDWKRPGPSVVASRILSETHSGSIILSHDLHAGTVDAMPRTLDGLLSQGYHFLTVPQLIAMKSSAPATSVAS